MAAWDNSRGTVTHPCWHCSGFLWTHNFKVIRDPLGNEVKVHRDCRDDAVQSLTLLTAQESDPVPPSWKR